MTAYRILYHHRIRADDGQAVHVRELIGALREIGHEVLECALVPKAGKGHGGGATPRGGGWQRLKLPRAAVEAMEIGYQTFGTRKLVAAGRAFRPHFLYERHALHCGSGLAAARRLGVPLLLEVNSPMTDEMAALGLLRFRARAERTERRVLGGADAVLAVTEVLRQRLLERGARPQATFVIGNGSDPSRYGAAAEVAARAVRARFPAGAFLLGFVGYMRPWHRLDLALAAMQRPGLERVHLVMLGEGPALADLARQAADLRLSERLHTMGVVAHEQLPGWVRAFDAALIPAINAYASPLKLFDSLAAGVPTLAPDQPNLREYVRDGTDGLLFAPGDGAALAEKLALLVREPARAAAIGAAGRQTLLQRDWTWTGNAARVAQRYQELAR